jgi:hypothetical protein
MRKAAQPHGIYMPWRAHTAAKPTDQMRLVGHCRKKGGDAMPSLDDLWQWTSELKASLPFAIALPIAVAIAFATLVDWIERHLTALPTANSQQPAQADWTGMQRHDPSSAAMHRAAVATRQTAAGFDGERR